MKKLVALILILGFVTLLTTGNFIATSSASDITTATFKDGLQAADWAYSGLAFISDPGTGVPIEYYNIKDKTLYRYNYVDSFDNADYLKVANFAVGLSPINAYMATGNDKYLGVVKKTADLLNSVLPPTGLVPIYFLDQHKIMEDGTIFPGTNGQASIIEYISYLARSDSSYIPLLNKLVSGLITYGINPENDLAWFQVYTKNGTPVNSPVYGYDSQLGSQSVSCAEALLTAYETEPSQTIYKTTALDILKAIWNTRNQKTNLISEVYDIKNNTPGGKLYPYEYFRYDDMGGAYIRGLTMAYEITKDKAINSIAGQYIPALLAGTWDPSINGGAFRYLSTTGGTAEASYVETMQGLFIASLLNANDVFYKGTNRDIINKCSIDAQHTIVDGFSLKNDMEPHQVNHDGAYVNHSSDSELAYTVIQYPLGYEKLSQVTQNPIYREADDKIITTLLDRFKMGDNIHQAKGFVNILETTPPYNFETDYSHPEYMWQAFFIPAYLLFNSIHPTNNVTIDWYNAYGPNVFGLDSDMPFWNPVNVSITNNTLNLNKVTGKGDIDLSDMGSKIISVKIDHKNYTDFHNNIIHTESGTHAYSITFENLEN